MMRLSFAFACLALAACSDSAAPCAEAAPAALRECVADYGARVEACYAETGAPCAEDDRELGAILRRVESRARASCGAGDFGALDADAVAPRLRYACESEASSVAWRSYGGPHSAVYPEVNQEAQTCLRSAHATARGVLDASFALLQSCVDEGCDAAALETQREALESAAEAEVGAACPSLSSLVAVDAATFTRRAARAADCLISSANPDVGDVALECGPSYAQFEAPRGEWTQVRVDGDEWGTLCGDGSGYAFWIRPAPEGAPLDRVVVALQGGGVCLFGEDCGPRFDAAPGLFDATGEDDRPIGAGIGSDDPETNPFADWTRIYLPYCNQDVFAGGGVVEDFGEVQVPRYGSVNLRAAVRMTRDWLWRAMDAEGGAGFRPDELVALFGGFSAGAYGTLYNYHWFLDDLLWPRTIAFPDAGLAIDNGGLLSVGSLGEIKIPAWGMQNNLPPYCFFGPCSGGETLLRAAAPRLLRVPEQRMLLLSNQRDATQAGDAFFSDDASFINALRRTYCDTRDLPGVHWYLTSESAESVHVVSVRDEFWLGEVAGEVMSDFFERAVSEPETLQSRVEEGDFVEVIDGVEPFPCML